MEIIAHIDTDTISPWDHETSDFGPNSNNIVLRFNQSAKLRQAHAHLQHRQRDQSTIHTTLQRKREGIIDKLTKRIKAQMQTTVTRLRPNEEMCSQEIKLAQMFPNYPLKKLDRNKTFYKPQRYLDRSLTCEKQVDIYIHKNKTLLQRAHTFQDTFANPFVNSFFENTDKFQTTQEGLDVSQLKQSKSEKKSFIIKASPFRSKTSERDNHINKQKKMRIFHGTQCSKSSERYMQLMDEIKLKQKKKLLNKTKVDDQLLKKIFEKNKQSEQLRIPKIQIIQVKR